MSVRGYEVWQKPAPVKSSSQGCTQRGRVVYTLTNTTTHHTTPTAATSEMRSLMEPLKGEKRRKNQQESLPLYLQDLAVRTTTQVVSLDHPAFAMMCIMGTFMALALDAAADRTLPAECLAVSMPDK
ncbi:hypothetical protein E2C01_036634 [Portunus trituberculatus]|uniref:Uncharacterized protein n=1 Tax=Portunus trituberculatus TaxID=210409 RepID=A0A5B7FCL5_PORTR|nr:hypothetical protein [Portunus trituberculatus]